MRTCEYCGSKVSSGDIILAFEDNSVWQMPEMILHYVACHQYFPNKDFVNCVMHLKLTPVSNKAEVRKVGYLEGPLRQYTLCYELHLAPFFMKLWTLIEEAKKLERK